MQRRTLIATAAASALGLALPAAHAQLSNLSEAINKAGRQRMLSQRMSKAWLAVLQNVERSGAQSVLDKSMALFDRQLTELKGFAPTPDIQATYGKLESVWQEYKSALVGSVPTRNNAATLLQLDAKVLELAHKGTVLYETALSKPAGKLVNVAGRQRMLSQRIAKFYLAASLPVNANQALVEIGKARTEFVAAMAFLRNAPEATPRILEALQLADAQWVFFDTAIQQFQDGAPRPRLMAEVFVSSENLLAVMDQVTGLYSALKT